MTMRPACGRSSPARQRSVVVLPQPDGPSSVNSCRSRRQIDAVDGADLGCRRRRLFAGSRLRTSGHPAPLSPRRRARPLHVRLQPAQAGHDDNERQDLNDAERRDRAVAAAFLPHREADGAEHVGAGPDQEDRGAELAHREHEHVNPGRQQDRQQERQQDAAQHLAGPRARHLGDLLELAMNLRDPARREAHAVGQLQRHIGDQQDPDRVVDGDRQHQIGEQDAGADDHARDGDRRRGDRVEEPAETRRRAPRHPGHDQGETATMVAAMAASMTLVFTASRKIG